VKGRPFQDNAEMRHRDVVAVDRVVVTGSGHARLHMRDDLVAEEIVVDPAVRRAALREAENHAIKVSRGLKIVDRKGDMERRESHNVCVAGGLSLVNALWTGQRPSVPFHIGVK